MVDLLQAITPVSALFTSLDAYDSGRRSALEPRHIISRDRGATIVLKLKLADQRSIDYVFVFTPATFNSYGLSLKWLCKCRRLKVESRCRSCKAIEANQAFGIMDGDPKDWPVEYFEHCLGSYMDPLMATLMAPKLQEWLQTFADVVLHASPWAQPEDFIEELEGLAEDFAYWR